MGFIPSHVVFSKPKIKGGKITRGVVATDAPQSIQYEMDRSLWFTILFFHSPIQPTFHPDVDLYLTAAPFLKDCPTPVLELTARELVSEHEFTPLGIAKTHDVIFNVTWMPMKRHELLVEALKYAKSQGRPLKVLWFGYHYNEDAIDRERMLRKMVADNELDVAFLETNFDPAEINRRFNVARSTLICSEYEAGPRVMSESLLADVPFIITSDTRGGAVEAMRSPAGIICEPDGRSIAEAIWKVVDGQHAFQPRHWALKNMCRTVAIENLKRAVSLVAQDRGWSVNYDEIEFREYDWEGKGGHVRKAEAALCWPWRSM